MAQFVTTIASSVDPAAALAYMAAFENALDWDPSVTEARRVTAGDPRVGSTFDLVARFGPRAVPLRYTITALDDAHVVLEARRPGFSSRDTISVRAATGGSAVTYDALLEFHGIGRIADPLMGWIFGRVGRKAEVGLRRVLNP